MDVFVLSSVSSLPCCPKSLG